MRGEWEVGWLGQISPELREHLDLDGAIFVFELDLDAVLDAILPSFRPVSRYPAVARDLSLVVKNSVSADALRNCICAATGDLLTALELLDVYQGKGIPKNHSSLTYRLTLQADYRNLTDTEVDELIVKVVSAVTRELSGELRT
jgi:phenylalanyl-tRNA synthetase beta chain